MVINHVVEIFRNGHKYMTVLMTKENKKWKSLYIRLSDIKTTDILKHNNREFTINKIRKQDTGLLIITDG